VGARQRKIIPNVSVTAIVLSSPEKITVVASVDLSKPAGDTVRVVALSNELACRSFSVTLVVPTPRHSKAAVEPERRLNVERIPAIYDRGLLGMFRILVGLVTHIKARVGAGCIQVEGTLLGFLATMLTGNRVVLDVHGLLCEEIVHGGRGIQRLGLLLLSRFLRFIEYLAVTKAWKVIVVSRPMKRYFCQRWRRPPDNIEVIPNGYFPDLVARVSGEEIEPSTVTFVGQISAWSGVNRLIENGAELTKLGMNLRIVGGGPLLGEISENPNAAEIELMGFRPQEEVYRLVASSELVVAPLEPSAALEVACPIKLLEYMALGKPIITEDVGEIPLVLRTERAALVVPVGQIGQGVRELFRNPKARKKLGRRAHLVAARYAWSCQGKKLSRIFQAVPDIDQD